MPIGLLREPGNSYWIISYWVFQASNLWVWWGQQLEFLAEILVERDAAWLRRKHYRLQCLWFCWIVGLLSGAVLLDPLAPKPLNLCFLYKPYLGPKQGSLFVYLKFLSTNSWVKFPRTDQPTVLVLCLLEVVPSDLVEEVFEPPQISYGKWAGDILDGNIFAGLATGGNRKSMKNKLNPRIWVELWKMS